MSTIKIVVVVVVKTKPGYKTDLKDAKPFK